MSRSVVSTGRLDSAGCTASNMKSVWEIQAREKVDHAEERRRWIYMYNLLHEVVMYDSHTNSFYELVHNALRNIQKELGSHYCLNLAEESASGLIFCYGVRPNSRHRSMTFGLQIWACNPITGKFHKLPPYVDLASSKYEIHLTPVPVPVHEVSAKSGSAGSYNLYVLTKPAHAPPSGASVEMKIYRYSSEVRDWTRLKYPFPLKMRIANSTALKRFQHQNVSLYMSEAISSTSLQRATPVKTLRFDDPVMGRRCSVRAERMHASSTQSCLIGRASWIEAFERNGELLLVVVERDEDLHCQGCSIYSLPLNFDEPLLPRASQSSSNLPLRQQHQSYRGLDHKSKSAAAWKHESHSETKNVPSPSSTKLTSMPADIFLKLHGNPSRACTKEARSGQEFDMCRKSSCSSGGGGGGSRRTPAQQTASDKAEEESCRSYIRVFAVCSDDHLLFFSVLTGEIARFTLGNKEWTSSSIHDTTTASNRHDGWYVGSGPSVQQLNYLQADWMKVVHVTGLIDFRGIVFDPRPDVNPQ